MLLKKPPSAPRRTPKAAHIYKLKSNIRMNLKSLFGCREQRSRVLPIHRDQLYVDDEVYRLRKSELLGGLALQSCLCFEGLDQLRFRYRHLASYLKDQLCNSLGILDLHQAHPNHGG